MREFLTPAARALKPSGIRKYFDIVETLPDAISLGVGEPDFVTPWNIRSAGIRSLQRGDTSYTGNRGLTELRELISRYLGERFGVNYPPEHIIVTVGASEGIDLALRATTAPGDEVLVPDPAYVSYAPIIGLCGGVAVPVRCTAGNGFILTPEAVEEGLMRAIPQRKGSRKRWHSRWRGRCRNRGRRRRRREKRRLFWRALPRSGSASAPR